MTGGIEVRGNNIVHRRGDTGYLDVVLFMGDEVYEIQDEDSGLFTVKKKPSLEEVVLQKEMTSDGGFVLEPSDTSGLKAGTYYYDIQITLRTGEVVTIANGKYKLLVDITTGVST